ncbi:MAG: N-acetylmuramoyl-L-alanine amidase [Pseudomonadota bacterium]
MRRINEIIVHCTDTRRGQKADVAEIRRWHVDERGWSDIGYHLVIGEDGRAEEGRPIERAGAHCYRRNGRSIGIALAGGYGVTDARPEDTFTPAQLSALIGAIRNYRQTYGPLKLSGHRDYDKRKACPTFDVRAWAERNGL